MGALVGAMESQFLDGFEVTMRAAELLVLNGWTRVQATNEPAAPRIQGPHPASVGFKHDL